MTETFPYHGQCRCGACAVLLHLPKPIEQYTPRACDCNFCQTRNIAYLSDPDGSLMISLSAPLDSLKQGSEQARFIACQACSTVLAATVVADNRLIGAVNCRLLDAHANCQLAEPASPKLLSAEEKFSRWQKIWLPVTFISV